MSSIAPGAAQEICAAVKAKGIVMLDAPSPGGEPKAIEGTLAIMAGGDAKAFETVKPILEKGLRPFMLAKSAPATLPSWLTRLSSRSTSLRLPKPLSWPPRPG